MEDKRILTEFKKAYADAESLVVQCLGYDGGLSAPLIPWYLVFTDGVIHLCYYDTDGRVYESEYEDDFIRIVKDKAFTL